MVNNGEESMEEIFSITSPRQILMKCVAFHICLFISFFQLCYHVSERGITLLLNFIRSLISWLSRFAYSPDLLQLRDMIPENVYFLKKIFKGSNDDRWNPSSLATLDPYSLATWIYRWSPSSLATLDPPG